MAQAKWQFWIDRGGSFTDIVARRPDGALVTHKLLSDSPDQYRDAAVAGIRHVLEAAGEHASAAEGGARLAEVVSVVKMGTTVATNALLERKGERTALAITRGFGDALRIAYQNRPRLFDRHVVLPELLHDPAWVVEIDERVGAGGDVLVPLDAAAARAALARAYDAGLRALAIVLMHGYRYPAHEAALAGIARAIGFDQVSVSHEVSPLVKLVARGDTTVVDAYLSPILGRYVRQVADALPGVRLELMQSSGGLTDAWRFRGKDAVLSGPAGGIAGMVRTSLRAGFDKVIGFDMGGTSTDVSSFAGTRPSDLERVLETQVAGVRMRAPMLPIHTVAAGGGSILGFDGARLRVGPESAGASPGPACYRRGGPLTVTDCNVMLGKIQPDCFPRLFGPRADQPLDADVVRAKLAALAAEIAAATATASDDVDVDDAPRTPEHLAEGFISIAVANMANAIKQISIARGHDVTAYTLAVFGGAGGQHACLVADALGMKRIFAHALAGVLSAYGMGLADRIATREKTVDVPLDDVSAMGVLQATLDALADDARAELLAQEVEPGRIEVVRRAHLRYQDTDTAIAVAVDAPGVMRAAFEEAYRRRFAFLMPERALVVETASVEAIGLGEPEGADAATTTAAAAAVRSGPLAAARMARMFSGGRWHDTPLYRRDDTRPGDVMRGPAIIAEQNQTTVVEPDWQAAVTPQGHLVLERVAPPPAAAQVAGDEAVAAGRAAAIADPVLLELFANLFMSIAEQMGLCLQNAASSVNIKERLDFSCAIFDADGNLVANAPHVPVHLGSMGESIKTVIRDHGPGCAAGRMKPGDVFVLNAPYNGGTHLPDVTVMTPVFDEADAEVLFYVGSRGHHADVGGTAPGSMPADSTSIEDEGALIDDFTLVDGGVFREAEMRALLGAGRWPARNPDQNLADLRAQVAANAKGASELRDVVARYGPRTVAAYMRHVQDHAEEAVRRAIAALDDGAYEYRLDPAAGRGAGGGGPGDGPVIKVAIRVDRARREATIDFTGTSPALPTNFNAPKAITMAVVLYVFRTLVDADIPLNAGCMRPLRIVVPDGSMLSPRHPAAVVAGNVETSQCVAQALYGALGLMSESQGSMNNVTFGNQRHQYYETLAGGSAAGVRRARAAGAGEAAVEADVEAEGFAGTDAVQTHMTNSRLTDPEVLEWRFPVRVEEHRIRRGSGGAGRWKGGDGAVRRIRFLERMTASVLSNNRVHPPRGLAGGADGLPGLNRVERASGAIEELPSCAQVTMEPGDVFVIETPGAGGYGRSPGQPRPPARPPARPAIWTIPFELRAAIRAGAFRAPTAGQCPGYVQANLAVLPHALAADFQLFCQENPRACPLIGVTAAPGDARVPALGADIDVRVDLPGYCVFRHGEWAGDVTDLRALWRHDLVGFVLGCSFSFEEALVAAGVPLRHLDEDKNVAMYRTSLPNRPVGPFAGNMVVSMRPIARELVELAIAVTAGFPAVHGAPVHVGDPGAIGIADLARPDFGDAVAVAPGEVPVFWACGVTPQEAIRAARPTLSMTHKPGHMLVTDRLNSDLDVL
jgi:5-oxoprolinase (ATP-hydrolysing)